jgi:ABC-type uncharacterized transport system involved in gliding motility, auxiliary component
MTSRKKRTLTTTSLVILAVLFIALTTLTNTLLRGQRIDLTQNKLYTISSGTKNILNSIEEPINLYFFFSDRATEDIPYLRTYATRVRELLEEFKLNAQGKLRLNIIDPLPFSEEEDRASQFGLKAVPAGPGGGNVYLGLAGTNAVDSVEVISFFQPDEEPFLEYELSKLIYTLAHPKKPVIGLISSLPMTLGFDPLTQRMREPWIIARQMEQLFEVRALTPPLDRIEDDIDVLMLVHPKDLNDKTLYAIDQFVLGGGKAIVFVDPYSEATPPLKDPHTETAALFASRGSELPELLKAWGVEMDSRAIVGDHRYALAVAMHPAQAPVRHLGILSVNPSGFAREDVITSALSTVNVAYTGFLKRRDGAATTLLPLLESSDEAMPIPTDKIHFLPNPATLHQDFKATGARYPIAARVQGKAQSAFPQVPGENAEQKSASSHLSESAEPINVIVVADTDLLTDHLWVRVQDFFGQPIASAFANNGDFVINALDNLTGSSDLINIRGRATSTRPFLKVEALQREAEQRFRATEFELQQQLQETERKLNELQRARDEDDNSLILSPEQRAELSRFQEQKLTIRKKLRQVRRDLDSEIEQLGTTLKLINIGLMPLLISLAALAMVAMRIRTQRSNRVRS